MDEPFHPFRWIVPEARRGVLAALALLLLATSLALVRVGGALTTGAAPRGIVSFELAGSAERSAAILASWPPAVREQALLSLGLDFLYLLVYPAFLSLACALLALRLRGLHAGVASLGLALSWAVLAAGAFDAVENWALIRQLAEGPAAGWARLALLCATPKFALVAVAGLYAVLAWLLARAGARG